MSQVTVARTAAENLERLPSEQRQEIFEAIEDARNRPGEHLERTPNGLLQLRVGEYVAVFSVEDTGLRLWRVGKPAEWPDEF